MQLAVRYTNEILGCKFERRYIRFVIPHLLVSNFERLFIAGARTRLTLSLDFENGWAKEAFCHRLDLVRSKLTPVDQQKLKNSELLTALFELVEGSEVPSLPGSSRTSSVVLSGSSSALSASGSSQVSVVQFSIRMLVWSTNSVLRFKTN